MQSYKSYTEKSKNARTSQNATSSQKLKILKDNVSLRDFMAIRTIQFFSYLNVSDFFSKNQS